MDKMPLKPLGFIHHSTKNLVRTTKDKKAVCNFEVAVKDPSQLTNEILELQKIKGIIGVNRIMT